MKPKPAPALRGAGFMFLLLYVSDSIALRLTSVKIPQVVDPRDSLEIDCHFDMGNEYLYAVKWYKDEHEFFRYLPRESPSILIFPVYGIQVVRSESDCDQTHCKVKLINLSKRDSSGLYRCEVSSEAPWFRLASETKNITVAALPKDKPRIEGLAAYYSEGDILSANCTSDYADPPPTLRWFVDGEATIPVSRPTYIEREDDGLIAQTIMLNMMVTNVSKSSLEIGCEASLSGIPFIPQLTISVIHLRSNQDTGLVNNEKLQLWYSPYFYSSSPGICISYQKTLLSILLIIVVKFVTVTI